MANTLKFGNGEWATKKGSTLAYNDENGNFKPLPFTFDRSTSATRVNKQGLIEVVSNNEPRIDFLNDSKGALLLEPQRSNLVTYSEDISNSFWTKDNISITNNSIVSPDGLQTADKLVENTSNSKHRFFNNNFGLTSGSVSLSCFAKAGERDELAFSEGVGGNGIKVNLTDGTFTLLQSATGGVDFIGNGWYHIYFSYTVSSFVQTRAAILKDDVETYQGDGSSGLYVWGLQQEVGSYATSYIPTQGGVVTRLAESCSQTPPSGVIGQTEGTIYAEAKINGLKDSNTIVTLHNGSFSEYLVIAGNNSGNINAYIFAGGVQQAGILSGTIYAVDSIVKCAMAYKENDVAFYINGVLIGTDSSATMASTNFFDVGSISFGNYPLNGSVKQTKLYNTRLSNSELQALTSN